MLTTTTTTTTRSTREGLGEAKGAESSAWEGGGVGRGGLGGRGVVTLALVLPFYQYYCVAYLSAWIRLFYSWRIRYGRLGVTIMRGLVTCCSCALLWWGQCIKDPSLLNTSLPVFGFGLRHNIKGRI